MNEVKSPMVAVRSKYRMEKPLYYPYKEKGKSPFKYSTTII